MTQNSYTYQYPHPAITADCVILAPNKESYNVLLIQRRNEPFKGMWALPGGFMNIDETIENCAQRELMEEAGINITNLQQLRAFSTIDRDPRERIVTIAFWSIINEIKPKAGDDAKNAKWFSIENLPQLACDHATILKSVLNEIQRINQLPRDTPSYIKKLQPNEIFVFGSNLEGQHAGGAARTAYNDFGAIWGQGIGLQGQSYAIPTMQGGVETIKPYVDEFIIFACQHPEYKFLVTPIGCGIAGFEDREIAPLFANAKYIQNITLPKFFWQYI